MFNFHFRLAYWYRFDELVPELCFQSTPKTDTSAIDARNGKDIQGIPWERFSFSRDNYREKRLSQYKNYESLSSSRATLEKVPFPW